MSRLWYVPMAVHFWRFYFRYTNADPTAFSDSSRLNWESCSRAIKKFSQAQVDLLREYYMTSWGNYEDLKVIKEFAEQRGIETSVAWNTIKAANYEVIIERGLMERREVNTDEPGNNS